VISASAEQIHFVLSYDVEDSRSWTDLVVQESKLHKQQVPLFRCQLDLPLASFHYILVQAYVYAYLLRDSAVAYHFDRGLHIDTLQIPNWAGIAVMVTEVG
jgi:hypothetical protein